MSVCCKVGRHVYDLGKKQFVCPEGTDFLQDFCMQDTVYFKE